jgi:hypothetical protein
MAGAPQGRTGDSPQRIIGRQVRTDKDSDKRQRASIEALGNGNEATRQAAPRQTRRARRVEPHDRLPDGNSQTVRINPSKLGRRNCSKTADFELLNWRVKNRLVVPTLYMVFCLMTLKGAKPCAEP